jgi:hypothetical protein
LLSRCAGVPDASSDLLRKHEQAGIAFEVDDEQKSLSCRRQDRAEFSAGSDMRLPFCA